MDYEKKYKDALSIAKGVHSYSSDITEIKRMEQIFPELAESEDERIRKEIISALKYANHEGVYNKHLAWLEKQGEKEEVDGFDAELNALLKKYEYLPKEELAECLEFYLGVVKNMKI